MKAKMQRQTYQQADDLRRVQAALMRWVQQAGQHRYLHKGDVGHRVFNGGHRHPPQDLLHYWTDDSGQVIAFASLNLGWESFDLQVAPEWRLSDAHTALFEWCETQTLRFAERVGKPLTKLMVEVADCDPTYREFVEARGYRCEQQMFFMTRHDYDPLPPALLPPGFRFHDAQAADAEQLADVHNHSFTNKWTAESYGQVFAAPHIEYELVVVAPDGRFAAFTNLWVDAVNRSLLFEPVGTHSDFRRRGIGKALMVYALRRMQAQHSLRCAYVGHESADKNPASGALYAAVGFKKLHEIHDYARTFST